MTGTSSKTCCQCQITKRLADFPTKITFISIIPWRTNRSVSDVCRSCSSNNECDNEDEGGFLGFWRVLVTLVGLTGLAAYVFPAFQETNFFKIVMGTYVAIALLAALFDFQNDD